MKNRRFVLWGGISLIVLLSVWLLLNYQIDSLRETMRQEQALLAWVIKAGDEVNTLRSTLPKPKPIKQLSLLALVEQTAKDTPWGTFMTEIKQAEHDTVQVTFNNITFDDLINALEVFWEKENVQVAKLTVQRVEALNVIQATVVLQQ